MFDWLGSGALSIFAFILVMGFVPSWLKRGEPWLPNEEFVEGKVTTNVSSC